MWRQPSFYVNYLVTEYSDLPTLQTIQSPQTSDKYSQQDRKFLHEIDVEVDVQSSKGGSMMNRVKSVVNYSC
jgi:hypothetical protein